jgi:voltage-gated potassium channel
MDFVEGILAGRERSFYIEEFLLEPDSSPCVGQTLAETQLLTQSGGLVLAIRRADGNLIGSPAATETLQAGDVLFCMGTAEQLRQMNQILEPNRGASPRTPKESS